jgi:hypothetical protein
MNRFFRVTVCSVEFFILRNRLEFLIVVHDIVEVGMSGGERLKLPMLAESAARATRENVTPRRRFFPAFFCLASTILRSTPPTLRTSGHYVRRQFFSIRHAGLQRWL